MYYNEWLVEPEIDVMARPYDPSLHRYDVIDYIFEKYNQIYSSIHVKSIKVKPLHDVFDCVIDTVNNIYFTFTFQNNGQYIEIKLYELTDELLAFVNQWTAAKASIGRNNITFALDLQ